MADNFFKIRNGISLGSLTFDPSNPQNGDTYYNTTRNVFRKYENGVWTDVASGQANSVNLIKGGTWSWVQSTNTLSWSAQAFVQFLGTTDDRNTIATGSVTLTDGQVAYVDINRTPGISVILTVNTSAQSAIADQAGRFIIARRVGNDVIVGNSFLLKDREYLELDGALAEVNRRLNQLRLQTHLTAANKVLVSGSDITQLDGAILSQELNSFVMNFGGSVINFTTGAVLASDDTTALGVNFTPFSVPTSQYFWYGIGAIPASVGSDNRIGAQILVTPATAADAVQANAPYPNISADKKLGAVQVFNNGGTIQVVAIRRFGAGSSSSGTGDTTKILEALKNEFVDSPYELLTPNVVATDTSTKFASFSGATYDVVNKVIKFTANAQTATSVQMLDTNEFISRGLDVGSVDLSLFWNKGTILQAFAVPDTAITYTSLSATTLSGSAAVTVTTPVAHNLVTGSRITVTTSTSIDSISSGNLSQTNVAITVLDTQTFTYTAGASASSTATGILDTVAVLGFLYEVSRDAGTNWSTIAMTRVGTTDTLRGNLSFSAESVQQSLASIAGSSANRDLAASSSDQQLSQLFTVTANQTWALTKVILNITKVGTPNGNLYVSIVKNASGNVPSALGTDILSQTSAIVANSLVNGANTITLPTTTLAAGTYHVVVSSDATYKATPSFASNKIQLQETTSTGESSYNGTAWGAVAAKGLIYTLQGRSLDLRVRITSAGSPTYPCGLDGYGIFYNLQDVGIVGATKKLQRFAFNSVTDNLNSFNITAFNPDPDLLECFYAEAGKVFKVPAFSLNGTTAQFPTNTFNNGGVSSTVTLIFTQNTGGAYDNSDTNARLLATNHLGSSSGSDDKSSAGRGIILRNAAGVLVELSIDASNNIIISSVP